MKNSLLSWSSVVLHICFIGSVVGASKKTTDWVANPYTLAGGGATADYLLSGEGVSLPDWGSRRAKKPKKVTYADELLDEVQKGNVAAVRAALAEPGFDINHEYKTPKKPETKPLLERLRRTFFNKNTEVDLVDSQLESLEGDHGTTLLHTAVVHDQLEIAALLFEHGANIEALANYDQTPLHAAARFGRVRMIDFLIDRGANKEAKNGHSLTPLVRAIYYKQLDAMRALIRHGVLTEQPFDWRGIKPVAIAAQWGHDAAEEILKQATRPPAAT